MQTWIRTIVVLLPMKNWNLDWLGLDQNWLKLKSSNLWKLWVHDCHSVCLKTFSLSILMVCVHYLFKKILNKNKFRLTWMEMERSTTLSSLLQQCIDIGLRETSIFTKHFSILTRTIVGKSINVKIFYAINYHHSWLLHIPYD